MFQHQLILIKTVGEEDLRNPTPYSKVKNYRLERRRALELQIFSIIPLNSLCLYSWRTYVLKHEHILIKIRLMNTMRLA